MKCWPFYPAAVSKPNPSIKTNNLVTLFLCFNSYKFDFQNIPSAQVSAPALHVALSSKHRTGTAPVSQGDLAAPKPRLW